MCIYIIPAKCCLSANRNLSWKMDILTWFWWRFHKLTFGLPSRRWGGGGGYYIVTKLILLKNNSFTNLHQEQSQPWVWQRCAVPSRSLLMLCDHLKTMLYVKKNTVLKEASDVEERDVTVMSEGTWHTQKKTQKVPSHKGCVSNDPTICIMTELQMIFLHFGFE